jgi:hypothetical protein
LTAVADVTDATKRSAFRDWGCFFGYPLNGNAEGWRQFNDELRLPRDSAIDLKPGASCTRE